MPFLSPSNRLGAPSMWGNMAFRHVRLVDGRLKVHLPPPAIVALTDPISPPMAVQLPDLNPPRSEPVFGHYFYEPELSTMTEMAFETVGFTQSFYGEQRHSVAGIRMWSNSTFPRTGAGGAHSTIRLPAPVAPLPRRRRPV